MANFYFSVTQVLCGSAQKLYFIFDDQKTVLTMPKTREKENAKCTDHERKQQQKRCLTDMQELIQNASVFYHAHTLHFSSTYYM